MWCCWIACGKFRVLGGIPTCPCCFSPSLGRWYVRLDEPAGPAKWLASAKRVSPAPSSFLVPVWPFAELTQHTKYTEKYSFLKYMHNIHTYILRISFPATVKIGKLLEKSTHFSAFSAYGLMDHFRCLEAYLCIWSTYTVTPSFEYVLIIFFLLLFLVLLGPHNNFIWELIATEMDEYIS